MSPRRDVTVDRDETRRPVARFADEPEEALEAGLRPRRLADFVGQARVKEHLAIVLEAARRRQQPVDHLLLQAGWKPAEFERRFELKCV